LLNQIVVTFGVKHFIRAICLRGLWSRACLSLQKLLALLEQCFKER